MDIGNFLSLEQRQLLSQTQIQALEILAMDNIELSSFMQNEYLENPLVEYTASVELSPQTDMQKFQEWYDKNRFTYKGDELQLYEEETGGYEPAEQEQDSIRDVVMGQIIHRRYSKKEMEVIEFLIDSLDRHGFVDIEPAEIAKLTNTNAKKAEELLEDLRQLEPFGIFAKDLPHCLLRQLEVKGIEDPILEQIILNHLTDIGQGKISTISRKMKLTTLEVRKYVAMISSLNANPMLGYNFGENSYIVPDIIVTYTNHEWNVSLNDNWIGDYRISDYYMKLMSEAKDQELFEYFKTKLERARFVMKSIEQRRETIRRIVEAVIAFQEDYLLGRSHLKPMNLADVAEKIGMHPSTVSRGIKGKYMQYPLGTVQIKNLFTAAVSGTSDGEKSFTADQVKKLIRGMIEKEDRRHPLSDQKLTAMLEEKNIHVSRRVVAKYREEMNIRGSFDRKELF